MRDFKIGTINLNGARDSQKRMCLSVFIKQQRIDVTFIQETHSDLKNEVDWKNEWDGQIFMNHMSSNSGGVAVLFCKKSLPIFLVKQKKQLKGIFEKLEPSFKML